MLKKSHVTSHCVNVVTLEVAKYCVVVVWPPDYMLDTKSSDHGCNLVTCNRLIAIHAVQELMHRQWCILVHTIQGILGLLG